MDLFLIKEESVHCESSKSVSWCTAVRADGGELLTEESEVKTRWASYFERLYQADPPAGELDVRGVAIPIILLTLQSTVKV